MKKLFLLLLMTIMAATLFMVGCDSDDEGTKPGSQDDPSYLTFIDQFEGLDEVIGEGIGVTFGFIDEIMYQIPTKTSEKTFTGRASNSNTLIVTYHQDSEYWFCTMTDFDQSDSLSFSYTDSIQFMHGETAVQWPDLDLLTQVKSFMTLGLSDNSGSIGNITQNIFITIAVPGSDILTLNGLSSVDVTTSFTDSDGADTTSCDIDFNYAIAINNLVMDMNTETFEDELPCPGSGVVTYTGMVDIACVGADEGSATGGWNVTKTFDAGTITTLVTSGDNSWSLTDSCYYEPGGGITADSSIISDILDSEETMGTVFKSLDLSMALIDHIPQAPGKIAAPFKSAEGDDVVITSVNSYSYENGWHIFSFDAAVVDNFTTDTVFIEGIDSVKLLFNLDPVQYPQSPADFDALVQHAHAGWTTSWGNDYGAIHHLIEVDGDYSPTDTVITINGLAYDTLAVSTGDDLEFCEIFVTMDQTINNLVMNVTNNDGCPESGAVEVVTGVEIGCTGDGVNFSYNDEITISTTVNNDGTITVTYDDSNASWSVTEPCGESSNAPATSPWF